LQTISIIADSSSTAQNYWAALSRPGAHGQRATFEVWVEAFGAELLFYFIVLDRFFPEEPSLHRTGYFKTVATTQLVWCVLISAVFYQKRLINGSS
jgi:hypothetical protein